MLKLSKTKDVYHAIKQELEQADIRLIITRKRVKNLNFRLTQNLLSVSAPHHANDADIIVALSRRLDWAVSQHVNILQRIESKSSTIHNAHHPSGIGSLTLWGEEQPIVMSEVERVEWYRQELKSIMPELFAKWQPIVGKTAKEQRVKKMKTRWGTCNTRDKRVWLSVYLPAYPIECTEYVIVHELCHLHHANHGPKFWNEVTCAMPDYKYWHDMLAGKPRNSF